MAISGILPLEKPEGMTSHDCVQRARRWFQTREIGHTGTLDPEVTGVLPLCIGRATKLVPLLMEEPKAYEGTMAIGSATTTEDSGGNVLKTKTVNETIPDDDVDQLFASLVGELRQVPPMYSAVKVNGKKLYDYARAGETVERPVRTVMIYNLRRTGRTSCSQDQLHQLIPFTVMCSKGTYVRTLAVEAGERLGYPAHLSTLRRTMSSGIDHAQCVSIQDMEVRVRKGHAERALLPIELVLRDLEHVEVNNWDAKKIQNGAMLQAENYPKADRLVFTKESQALAIYVPHPRKQGMIKPDIMLKLD